MHNKPVSNSTKALAKAVAQKGLRLGARGVHQFRQCRVSFGKSYGSCEVVFEPGTRVFSQVSATIGEPSDSKPGEGMLTVSVWVSPAATGEMVGNSLRPALIARALEKLLRDNRAVDTESLCIKFGEKAWILRVDVHIIDMNGCVCEAAALSVLGSLLTFRRPQAYIDVNTDELVVLPIEESTPIPLHLFHLPTLTSFALCGEDILLAEPNHEEEEIFPGKLTIGFNESKELCFLHILTSISNDVLFQAMKIAEIKCIERIKWLRKLAAEDEKERLIPGYLKKNVPNTKGTFIDLTDFDVEKAMSELSTS